ncbi:GFA family protein [Cognatishimia activa]|uniref:GFA family protein n=1 Tax=Cognatishimia activa TaxID=1715691 RepID=UPI003AF4097C
MTIDSGKEHVPYSKLICIFRSKGGAKVKTAQSQVLKGHCLCGACKFELAGPHNWVGNCYCESCRRATASPMTTWIGNPNGNWRFWGIQPKTYRSSDHAERGFCPDCGSQLYYKSERYPNEVHFYAALLEDPAKISPSSEYHSEERINWPGIAVHES